jgi:hypothetical protein
MQEADDKVANGERYAVGGDPSSRGILREQVHPNDNRLDQSHHGRFCDKPQADRGESNP